MEPGERGASRLDALLPLPQTARSVPRRATACTGRATPESPRTVRARAAGVQCEREAVKRASKRQSRGPSGFSSTRSSARSLSTTRASRRRAGRSQRGELAAPTKRRREEQGQAREPSAARRLPSLTALALSCALSRFSTLSTMHITLEGSPTTEFQRIALRNPSPQSPSRSEDQRLGDEGRRGRGLVLERGRELRLGAVVAREAVDTRLDENEAELRVCEGRGQGSACVRAHPQRSGPPAHGTRRTREAMTR